MKKLIFIIFILSYNFIYAQWEKTNWKGDPEIYFIVAHDNIILLRSYYDLIISSDYGKNWKKLNQKNLVSEGMGSVAFIENNIFISTTFGIYLSSDYGNTWHKRINGLTNYGRLFVIDDILYNISYQGIYTTNDLGNNWQKLNVSMPNQHIYDIALKENIIVASTRDGIFISTDAGKEWELKNNGLPNMDVHYFDEIVFFGENIIISTHEDTFNGSINYIYSSSDFGETWLKRNNSIIANKYTYSMITTSDAIVIEDTQFIYYSIDTCQSWVRINTDSTSDCGVYAIFPNDENIYVSIGGELFLTDKDWKEPKKLLSGKKNGQIESMISINSKLYIGAKYGWSCEFMDGIFTSSDFGSNWDTLKTPYIYPTSLASSGDIIVAGTKYDACFISTDGGKNFRASDTKDSVFKGDIISSVVLDDSNIIVCISSTSGWRGKIFISSDYGLTWAEKVPALDGIHVLYLAIDDDMLYAATENGVYLSTDMGANWILSNNGIPDDLTISTIEIKGENIFAGTKDGIYLSTDKGSNWQPINNGLPAKSDIRKIIFVNDYIFICNFENGVYMSSDYGKSWLPKNEGLENLRVSTFAIIENTLFVGTNWGLIGNDAVFKANINELTDVEDNNEISKNIIYPNPATEYITINLERCATLQKCGTSKVEIYDVMGMKIHSTSVETIHELSLQEIDISNLSPGVYFVKIVGSNGESSIVEKFVKI